MLAAERKIDHKEFHKMLNNLEKGDGAFENIIYFSSWYLVRARQPLKDLAKANKAIKTPTTVKIYAKHHMPYSLPQFRLHTEVTQVA